ncbi:MAG: sulfite exporter TauE/SafE family protein [Clostridia bacterium]|nr:sulfite exporter TauE/SafE family protein [Clostridia bacterium]
MVEVIFGFISGIISGTGMGGGAILIILLSLFRGVSQHVAQATNLIFFIPTSIAAIIVNVRNKKVNFRIGWQIIIFGLIGVFIGFNLGKRIEVNMLRRYFGIFLLLIALYEVYMIIKKEKVFKKIFDC